MNYEIINKTCEIHGKFESKRKVVLGLAIDQSCPKCQEIEKEQRVKQEAEIRMQEKIARISIMVNNSGLPKKYRNFKGFEFKESQKMIKDFDFKHNLIIYGGVGTGKTMLASYLGLRAIYDKNLTVRYLYASDIAQIAKATWGTKKTEDEALAEFINCDILILDEIGRCEYSDYIFKVFDARYLENKITILLGNVNIKEIPNILGEAIASRLRENVKAISFGQEDLRVPSVF